LYLFCVTIKTYKHDGVFPFDHEYLELILYFLLSKSTKKFCHAQNSVISVFLSLLSLKQYITKVVLPQIVVHDLFTRSNVL